MNKFKTRHVAVIIIFLLFILTGKTYATHIRAGEITVRNSRGLTYNYTLTLYTYTGSPINADSATLHFGDGSQQKVQRASKVVMDESQTAVNTYNFSHTYNGPGVFTVSYNRSNRNEDVLNMDNSIQTPFYVETQIVVDPFLDGNNSPRLQVSPIDKGNVNELYKHNPGAWDPDGDSLSYEMTIPRQNVNQPVNDYRSPVEIGNGTAKDGGPATFNIDPVTGQLTWNTPAVQGFYNVAFKIIEWRNGNQIGYVVRDMQIIIENHPNNAPLLTLPNDTCIVAGSTLNDTISGDDPDNDRVSLTSFGGVYNLANNPAQTSLKTDNPQPLTAKMFFEWNTVCNHIREQPYNVIFKAEDDHNLDRRLADLRSWQIKVVGPPPEGLTATPSGNQMELSWDPYNCTNANEPPVITIWRRKTSAVWSPDSCETGIPPMAGYEKIAEVEGGDTTYVDDHDLENAVSYCYRIVAEFPGPKNGMSIASEEVCNELRFEVPVITNVSVTETAQDSGAIEVVLAPPKELDSSLSPPPYKYEYYRINEQDEEQMIYETSSLDDTLIVDNGLNTLENQYRYYVKFLFGNDLNAVEYTDTASSVWLDTEGRANQVNLSWHADVPWVNNNQYHYIYREHEQGDFNLIDSIFVENDTFGYMDDGSSTGTELINGEEYCYYVTTQGTYGNEQIKSPLLNNSQEKCESPIDTVPPCPPQLTVQNYPCDSIAEAGQIVNYISWTDVTPAGCDTGIVNYNIYHAKHQNRETTYLTSTSDNSYEHSDLESRAGCYQVTALDGFDNESKKSNKVCIEGCLEYDLPNVFTPNNDGVNEVFTPKDDPVGVERSRTVIYNRWGKEVYATDDKYINWNGVDQAGNKLPDGVYYYQVELTLKTLDQNDDKKVYKGWVQLIR